MKIEEKLKNIVKPEILQKNLIAASLFNTTYENFKAYVVDELKNFYLYKSIAESKENQLKMYNEEVLNNINLPSKIIPIKQSLKWYKTHGVIDENDIKLFKKLTTIRNIFSHNLYDQLFEGFPKDLDIYFKKMIKLYEKISNSWLVELCADNGYNPQDIDWENVCYGEIEFIKLISDVALFSSEEYVQILKQEVGETED